MYLANMAPELFPGANFAVAHCNFSLRGEESDGDQAFVEDWCRKHSLPCFTTRFQTEEYAAENGISIEMAARDLRYSWFASLCAQEGFDALAVAHNANDNAETFILNLMRGTGSRGLRGMAADSTRMVDGKQLNILRPLLETSRKEIEDWMNAHGESWREDRSNADTVYKRNLIRHQILPLFEQLNPSYLRTMARDMEHLAQVDDIAEEYFNAHCDLINVESLLALEHWEYVLWRMLEPFGFSHETFEKLTALMRKYKESPKGTVTLGGKVFEAPDYDLKISRKRFILTKKN